MIISVNWLKQFTQIDASIDELTDVIGARLVEIEGTSALAEKYKDVVIVHVVECAPIPDSDHLNVTKIDDGGVVDGVERDDDGYVQVVCGAPNVVRGMKAAWLPPQSTVPDTYGDADPFVLGARKLRGFMSNGMLASARELALFDDHEGIVVVDKDVAPGTPFASAYALDDTLLDIENKSLTHRPDTFGIIGFAREVAAIAGKGFSSPQWFETLNPKLTAPEDAVELSVAIDDPNLSSRYQAIVLEITNAPTPLEVQTYLARSGVRPINAVVDVTNYLMLLTGQPLHAFDYDKVLKVAGSSHIHVREGHADETLALLDGRTITLTSDDIVIAAADTAIALAGAMGGADTEIDSATTRIIIESATFNLYNLRRTQMRHGIFSEAITRFTKGQPAALTAPVLARAVTMLTEIASARPLSAVTEDYPGNIDQPTIAVSIDKINAVLGTRLSVDDAHETLSNVQFAVAVNDNTLHVTPPFWRTDIHLGEDVIEEVGRLNGFDSIEPVLPARDFTAVAPDSLQLLRQSIRTFLSGAGANEVLTYSFVHGDLLQRAGQSPDDAHALANAISPDLQYYRLSITPSLLDKVNPNLRQKFDEFALYELGKTHSTSAHDSEEPELPAEVSRIAFTYAANSKRATGRGNAYYTVRRYVIDLLETLHIPHVRFEPLATDSDDYAAAVFEPKRSAAVYAGDRYVGIVGEYLTSVQRAFKLPVFSAGFELLLEPLHALTKEVGTYQPVSRFPSSDSDITFQVPAATTYGELIAAVKHAIDEEPLTITAAPQDIFMPDESLQNITLRFTFVSYDRTLTREDVQAAVQRIGASVTTAIDKSRIV